ncbi:2OG-Fe(II) oxygenase [Diaphorobacter aerolatus]|uniref:2OG-Fe(II) oxygenase n=1 Tax=Diaphorobacter aerolatus TaxID=1288495 RepID=A0A7H0GI47_9BURK|nr:2OG-Fe(II) oxygenase [Diaphorobacter aerolatus]QNP47963.1 2OG-Fe(II) oxygenase [Diaphorobacter aerolatus]
MPSPSSAKTRASASQQPITPELRQWIIAQAQAGHTAPTLLKSMTESGWKEDVAVNALEAVLRDHLNAVAVQNGEPEGTPVPEPQLDDSPLFIDVGDRQVEVLLEVAHPRIVLFGNLLSREECEALMAAATPRMARSKTVETQTGGEEVNESRTSEGMFFQRGENEIVKKLEARIARLVNWPLENGEGLQILRYGPGAEYKPHYDFFDPGEPGTATIVKRGGQRVGTLVIYLNNPVKGGGTVFPDIHLEVGPRQGNAVFFSYERPHASTKTLHGGSPVVEGEKWIATKWLRQGEFV